MEVLRDLLKALAILENKRLAALANLLAKANKTTGLNAFAELLEDLDSLD